MEHSQPDRAPGVSRGWLRRHAIALAVLAALVLAYTLAGFVLLPRLGRSAIEQYVQRDLGRKVSIGDLRFNPFTLTLEIGDFSLQEADGRALIGFDLLRVRASLRTLPNRAWTLGEVRLDRPVIHAIIDRQGRLNLAQLKPVTASAPPAAAPGPAPALRILAFTVHAGSVQFEDRSRERPFTAALTPIEFALTDFRTAPTFENRYRFSAATSAQERLEWSGEFSLQPLGSNGEFQITALKAATIAAYQQDALPFALAGGSIDVAGAYRYTTGAHGGLALQLPSLKLHALAIGPRTAEVPAVPPWVAVPELDVSDTALDLEARRIAVGQVSLSNPALRMWREPDGTLNLVRLLGAPGPGAAPTAPAVGTAAAAAPAAPAAPPWQITLALLHIDAGSIDAEDRAVKPAVSLRLAPIALDVRHYSSAPGTPIGLELKTGIGESGRFSSQGSIVLSPLRAALDFSLSGLDLPGFQPYIAQSTQMAVYRGRLAGDGHVEYAAAPAQPASPKGSPTLKLALDAQLTDFATRDTVQDVDFISWRALRLAKLRYQQHPDALEIARISLAGANARIDIGANGQLNVEQVLSTPGAPAAGAGSAAPTVAPTVAQTVAPAKAPKSARAAAKAAPSTAAGNGGAATPPATAAMPVRIGRVDIDDGTLAFSDHTVQPNFSAAILGLHGAIVGLSSDPAARAKVDLNGSVDQYAPVTISGEINPLAASSYTDIGMNFSNIELTTFNPYSGKFAGYSIAQGKLTTELHYHVENRKLQASHHVVIDQLEFGAATESKQAVPLPIKLAVSLLKDRNGVIDLQLPVDGSLDDPKFHIAPVVWKLLEGLLRKIVTAPFALLGSLFGGGEDLAFVDFPPGSTTLAPAQSAKLAQLAKALLERPQLKLDIPLHALNADDDVALERIGLDQALLAAQLPPAKRGSKPAAAPAAGDPRLPKLLALYRSQFQTEPEYPGDIAAGPAGDPARASWLEQQLLPQFAPGAQQRDELGRARAQAAQSGILGTEGLGAERVFLTDRSSGASGPDGAVRMELKLQ
jgi:hypothetical protein